MDKLKHRAGETLVEMLCSMLIISLGVLMLTGAVVSSARLNDSAQKITNQSENLDNLSEIGRDGFLIFKEDEHEQARVEVQIFYDRGNYRYAE